MPISMVSSQTSDKETVYRGRLAPSPTGLLHLGHAQTFIIAAQRAREHGGTLILRIEDIDAPRCKPEYLPILLKDLSWLGITWENDVTLPEYHQSQRSKLYHQAWQHLYEHDLIYPSPHSRKDVEKCLSAPHTSSFEAVFPPSLRQPRPAGLASPPPGCNWRFRVPDGEIVRFIDGFYGPQSFVAGVDFGDFLIWSGHLCTASYELAVVVDDLEMGITEVVRGEDLLLSTARQLLLIRTLGQIFGNCCHPSYYHCPLVLDADGTRLAKRTPGTTLQCLRQGVENCDGNNSFSAEACVGHLLNDELTRGWHWSSSSKTATPILPIPRSSAVKIMVFGASGNVGLPTVKALLAMVDQSTEEIEILAVSRCPSKLASIFPPSGASTRIAATFLEGDITSPASIAQLFRSYRPECLFIALPQCLTSKEMTETSISIANEAKKYGVQHIVRLSSYGIDSSIATTTFTPCTGTPSIGTPYTGTPYTSPQGTLGQAHIDAEYHLASLSIAYTSIRPTSFSTNFEKYDLPSIVTQGVFCSPLGCSAAARVNWVSVEDISRVAAVALMDASSSLLQRDGSRSAIEDAPLVGKRRRMLANPRILNVTGPPENSLTPADLAALLSEICQKQVNYREVSPPDKDSVPDMGGLWQFLRNGGFCVSTSIVQELTGRAPLTMRAYLQRLKDNDILR